MPSTVEITYTRPPLYPRQAEALFGPERLAVIEASTKSGKTVGAMAWLLEQAMTGGRPGRNYWWMAPVLAQARIAFRRTKLGMPQGSYQANDSECYIQLINGATIWYKGSDNPDTLYGEDVYAAVVDEASRCKEDAWYALRTTLAATQGPVRVIGNVKGRRNWFYRLARRAEEGEPGIAYHRITAADAIAAGVLSDAEVRAAAKDMPATTFRELFYAEPASDEGNPFGLEAIANCVAPLSRETVAVWGWDLARSVDWTVGIGLDASGRVAAFNRFQQPWAETRERMRQETQGAPALVDATGVGDVVLEDLQRSGMQRFEGFKFTAQSRQELLFGLMTAIQGRRVGFPEGPIRLELEGFEYEYTQGGVRYTAAEGQHDDCVMALALAVRHYGAKRIVPRGADGGSRARPVYVNTRW